MHILFADDSRATALPTIAFLKQQGHKVTYVENGRAALAAYQHELPDLVLLDVVMPEMDGIEATARIKALSETRWVPIMLMTGLSSGEEIVAGFNAGADDYLVKPISFAVLAARLRSMQRISTMQDSLVGILDNVFEAIITISDSGIIRSYNKAAERIFGHPPKAVMGANVKMLMPSPYADEHDAYLARYLRERTPRIIGIGRKVQGMRKSGETFPMRLAVTEVRRDTENFFIGLVSDISQEEAAREQIEFLALHDALTHLPNRAHFNNALEKTLQDVGDDAIHALLFIDLDGFKPINDTLGHGAGDEALCVVAGRLRHNLNTGDFIARLGGDEFVAIVRHIAGREAVQAIANRLLAAIAEPMSLGNTITSLGASIGGAMLPEHGNTANALLTAADNAMYAAKRAGKRRFVLAG